MNKIFAETYQSDLELINVLGLRTFQVFRGDRGVVKYTNRKKYLGTIREGNNSARVYVEALPAQFYRFRCKIEGEVFDIETGGGLFSEYYPFIKNILTGIIVINRPQGKG